MALAFLPFAGLRGANVRADLIAGLTLAAIAIPEQMATAQLAGFPPHVGFIVFIAGSLAFAAFGSSRVVSVGADSTIAPIFAGGLSALAAGATHYPALAGLLALLVGATLIVAAALRGGFVSDLLSVPVLTGFLAGISVHIAVSQAPDLLGLPSVHGDTQSRILLIAAHLDKASGPTMLVGVLCLAAIIIAEDISPRLPGALIALAGATLASAYLRLPEKGVAVLGEISHQLPHVAIPQFTLSDVRQVFGLAIIISLVIMVQTAATSRAFAVEREKFDIDGDLRGAGAGSILSALLGGFAVNASPPRTGIVVESGGASQLSGLVAAAIIAGVLLTGGGLLAQAPKAALAAVLMFVAGRIFHWRDMIAVWRATRSEFMLILATMAAVILLPMQIGVTLSIILSLLHGVWTTTRTRLIEYDRIPGTTIWWPASGAHEGERLPGVRVVAFQAPLSFLNADLFRRDVRDATNDETVRLVILEASSMVEIDYSAAAALRETIEACRKKNIDFAVARLESVRAQAAFDRFGISEALGPGRMFLSVDAATRALAPPATRP